ncbi:MAG: hypothetical protein HY735_22225 [Verrucomicrobia bacterium]|nr:hypothetical protein [Verrucomicrobiota bacterium]
MTVNNVTDTAVRPNLIAANSKAVFFAFGKVVQDADGFIGFEAEGHAFVRRCNL